MDELIVGDESAFLKCAGAGLRANQCSICAMLKSNAIRCRRMKCCVFLMDNNCDRDRTYNCTPDRSRGAIANEQVCRIELKSGIRMDKFREMEVFVAIVDQGSFTGAADKLGMSAPTVSRALHSLETRVGVQLIARTTRSIRPTDAGMAFLDASRKVLDTIADAEASIAAEQIRPAGTLTISAPVLFGQRFIAPLVNAYANSYPDVNVNVVYVDRTTRLMEEGVDIAIRIGHLGDSSVFAVPLGAVRRRTYAAPAYLEAHGEPLHPKDVSAHHCVSYTGVTHPLEWVFYENGLRLPVRVRPRMIVDLAPAAVMAAVDRVGITQLLSYQAAPEVLSGTLQRILTAFEPDSIPVNLLHVERKGTSIKVRSFVEFVTETLRRNVHLQFVDAPKNLPADDD